MSYLHVYVNLFNIHSIFQFNSKAWIVKSCLILQLCDLPHCFKQYLTSIPIWPFSLFITLCNRTPCVLWHKISPPIYVALDRFHCITERRMFLETTPDLTVTVESASGTSALAFWIAFSTSFTTSSSFFCCSADFFCGFFSFSFKDCKKKKRIWKSKLHWMHIQIRR